jgi:hypothetical protein
MAAMPTADPSMVEVGEAAAAGAQSEDGMGARRLGGE